MAHRRGLLVTATDYMLSTNGLFPRIYNFSGICQEWRVWLLKNVCNFTGRYLYHCLCILVLLLYLKGWKCGSKISMIAVWSHLCLMRTTLECHELSMVVFVLHIRPNWILSALRVTYLHETTSTNVCREITSGMSLPPLVRIPIAIIHASDSPSFSLRMLR